MNNQKKYKEYKVKPLTLFDIIDKNSKDNLLKIKSKLNQKCNILKKNEKKYL